MFWEKPRKLKELKRRKASGFEVRDNKWKESNFRMEILLFNENSIQNMFFKFVFIKMIAFTSRQYFSKMVFIIFV